jgi:hypothetical protein
VAIPEKRLIVVPWLHVWVGTVWAAATEPVARMMSAVNWKERKAFM